MKDRYSSTYNPILQINDGEAEQDTDHTTDLLLRRETWWMKYVPLCILIPTGTSLAILTLHLRHYKDSGTLYVWSASNRVLVQVIVHVLASVLAVFWVFSICTTIRQWTRHKLSKESVNLDTLRLWSAIVQTRADWNLPWELAFATLAFFTLSCIPAILWAGALTPAFTYSEVTNIPLSVQSGGPDGDYARPWTETCWNTTQSNGTFTNCLYGLQISSLLRSVATASSPVSSPRVHSKWDNTRFQFVGRSFGVGAAVGLTDHPISSIPNVHQYTYNEVGLYTETKCIHNESAVLTIELYRESDNGAFPNFYWAYGALPNSDWSVIMEGRIYDQTGIVEGMDFYAQSAFDSPDSIVSTFRQEPMNDDTRCMFGIISGIKYSQLNKTQCEITFQPSLFRVDVSVVNTTIKVSRVEETQIEDSDSTLKLRSIAMNSYDLSRITTSLFTSTVGDAFMENVRNLQARRSIWSDPNDPNDPNYRTVVLDAIAESVTSITDDSLVALSSAPLISPNATQIVYATAQINAVQIGSKPFIWATAAINLLALVAVMMSYRMLWMAEIPSFEYSDVGCMAVGLRQGIALVHHHHHHDEEDGAKMDKMQPWNGDPGDRCIGRLAISLQAHKLQ